MKIFKAACVAVFMSLSQIAFAGSPTSDEAVCPVGGKSFKITGTASCSYMGYTMSMDRITSCDFVTKLPQCPDNKLPMYKEFTDTDIAELESIMSSDEYKQAKKGSPYELAALIEQKLSSFNQETLFFILQRGIWHTPDQVMNNPTYLTAYHTAAENAFDLLDVADRPFWRGAQAFVYMQQDDLAAARVSIAAMKKDNTENNEFLASYTDALEYCLANIDDAELCSAESSLRAHEKKEK